jgi:hypothetical protein
MAESGDTAMRVWALCEEKAAVREEIGSSGGPQ